MGVRSACAERHEEESSWARIVDIAIETQR